MGVMTGNGSANSMKGTRDADVMFGEGGNDRMAGRGGDDRMHGGGGDDKIYGNAGNDVIFGDSTAGGTVDLNKFKIFEDTKATITFEGESAGFKNTLGMYKIADDGSIYDVEIVFSNASLRGSGGNLVGGQSSVDVDLNAGDRVGFFVVPNAYSSYGNRRLLRDPDAEFKFVNKNGEPANVNDDSSLKLVHVSDNGNETVVRSQYGSEVFHSVTGLNGDKLDHAHGELDTAAGTVTIGFEDLWRGGDKDYDDSVFKIEIGQTNAALLPKEQTKDSNSTNNDVINGGQGEDLLFGMKGDDIVIGGAGEDTLFGNSGNDGLSGGAGDDKLYGGKGDDKVSGGSGNDYIDGNTGNDRLFGDQGNDVLMGNSGNDELDGGAGADKVIGGSGDDVARGGEGDDHIEGGSGDDKLMGDGGNDALFGGSGSDVIADGDGNDKVDGGSGDEHFIAGEGDDYYNGGSGFDTLDYSNAKQGLSVDLSKHKVEGAGTDEVWSVERFVGSNFNDTIKGDKRDNVIEGGAGDDVIRGLGGSDTLTGGSGNDTFVWAAKDVVDPKSGAHLGVDHITDFTPGDRIDLHEMLKGQKYDNVSDVVRVTDGDKGASVSVRVGDSFVDVVTVSGVSADDLMDNGFIF